MNILAPRRKKRAFISQIPPSAYFLDVGCGSLSPKFTKSLRPDIYYVGVDIGDYRQSPDSIAMADEYIITTPELFANTVEACGRARFDAVISSHNLEHCHEPERVIEAMCAVLRPGGQLFLAFPCEASVNFPSRKETLNFYDDPTHRKVPGWTSTLDKLANSGMRITFARRRYRPLIGVLLGLIFEPFVAPLGRQGPKASTWALYGFESVIWAQKNSN
jgi:SAM-dependent methyltransferase